MSDEDVIAALGDPSRRALLDSLRQRDGQTVGELGTALPHLGRHAVLKHVAVLERCGLVVTHKTGRQRHCYLNPVPVVALARRWLDEYQTGWGLALDDLRRHAERPHDRHPEEKPMGSTAPRHVSRVVIAAPAERVWQALTDPEQSATWYYGTGFHSDLRPGSRYEYRFPDGRVAIEGVVERVEPPRLLVATFSAQWSEAVAAEPASRVTWEITTEGGLSTVTVVHEDVPAGSATLAEVTGGWPYLLSNLKTFVETGAPMPPPR